VASFGSMPHDLLVFEAMQPPLDSIFLDGVVIVQMMAVGAACTFGKYFDIVCQPFNLEQLESSSRVDIIWDVYWKDSLQSTTREKRESGTQLNYFHPLIPSNWQSFLCLDDKKQALLHTYSTRSYFA